MTDTDKLNNLIAAIKDMRDKQKSYFKSRRQNLPSVTEHLLANSKLAEREVDQLIELYSNPRVTQEKLF